MSLGNILGSSINLYGEFMVKRVQNAAIFKWLEFDSVVFLSCCEALIKEHMVRQSIVLYPSGTLKIENM